MKKTHPAADLFPLLQSKEFKALVEDIKKHGQQVPCYRLGGEILDGRNRIRACDELNIDPWIEDLDPDEVEDGWQFVMSMNYHRRHLSALDKGRALKAYLESRGGKKGASKGGRPSKNGKPRESREVSVAGIAKELGVPEATARDQIQAAEDYEALPAARKKEVDAGKETVATAKAAVEEQKKSPKTDYKSAKEKAKQERAFTSWLTGAVNGADKHATWFIRKKWSEGETRRHASQLTQLLKQIQKMRKSL